MSLVMKARPHIGEAVCVVGQGLIGLLTSAVIDAGMGIGTDLWAVDVRADRLAAAKLFLGRDDLHTWSPLDDVIGEPAQKKPEFDVCVEVSGSLAGLQTAVDNTGSHGRVVLGSWYGETAKPLKLGMKFHRSHIELVSSQVSIVPPELPRWSKARRFDVAWKMIKQIRPARLLSIMSIMASKSHVDASGEDVLVTLNKDSAERVQSAYERLARGEELTAMFVSDTERVTHSEHDQEP